MLPLRAGLAIFCAHRPLIDRIDNAFPDAGIDHRLDRKGHSRNHFDIDLVIMMGHFGRLVEGDADAMADELVDDAAAPRSGIVFDRFADLADERTGPADGDRPL